jgi:hypothetical protein
MVGAGAATGGGAVVAVDVAPISPSAFIPVVSAARPVPVVTAVDAGVAAGVPPPPPLNTISPELRGFRWRIIGFNSILYLLVKNVVERLKAIPASTFEGFQLTFPTLAAPDLQRLAAVVFRKIF